MDRNELERLAVKTKNSQAEQARSADQVAHEATEIAVEKKIFLEVQDTLIAAVHHHISEARVHDAKTTRRAAGTAQSAKQAYPELHHTDRGGAFGNKRRQSFASNFEMRRSNLIPIGTIHGDAEDGRTEGYIELIEEEVVLADRPKRSTLKGLPKGNPNPTETHPTGVYSRVGARILVGEPGIDISTIDESELTEVTTVMVPLVNGARRGTLDRVDSSAADPSYNPRPDIADVMSAASVKITPEQVAGVEQLAAIIDILEEHQAQPTPPAAP